MVSTCILAAMRWWGPQRLIAIGVVSFILSLLAVIMPLPY